jgi:2-polyprenyl-6-hydroxyphenyl methylase/3-demethylubiquinone-9 3-methyltransferase
MNAVLTDLLPSAAGQTVEPVPAPVPGPGRVPPLAGTHATGLACKCCGSPARLEGFVDFDRDCYGYNARRGQVRGLPIAYYRCAVCEFAFTDAFDHWTPADFTAHVYNDEYPLFDPRYAVARPRDTAALVNQLVRHRGARVLDYGSGNGLTARLLREAGYAEVVEYDPFHATHGEAAKPAVGGFDLVLCIEVAEHTTAPLELFTDLSRYVAAHGLILLSTKDMSAVQGRWTDDGYVAPRNGHVSFYTRHTLALLAASLGRDYLRIDNSRHLLVPRQVSA